VVSGIVLWKLNPDIWLSPLMILGTQWYILFNVIVGASAIPMDMRYAGQNFHVNGWLWWKRIALPAVFPFYVTGAITASGGSWNASVVSEVAEWGQEHLQAAGLGAGDERAHQRRAHSPALPGVGHHQADVGHPGSIGTGGTGLVRGHGVADDEAAPDRDDGVDALGAAAQSAEQRGTGCDRAEEPQVAAVRRKRGEEVAEGCLIRCVRRPDDGGGAGEAGRHERGTGGGEGRRAVGLTMLGSGHGLSIPPNC